MSRLRLLPYGDRAVLAEVDDGPHALGLAAQLRSDPPVGVVDVVPGARTVLVLLDPELTSPQRVREAVAAVPLRPLQPGRGRLVEIPVCYDGPDLDEVARLAGLAGPDEVAARHAARHYVVAFCGFAPGFGYLAGGDPVLAVPRRDTPRTRVPAGALAVAGEWSAVYPRASPGGWRLLGSTRLVLFDAERDPPVLLSPGTRVRFVAEPR